MLTSCRRIAILKPSALGDIVHSLPVLTALRHRFPEAQITWVVNTSYEPLLAGHPHLDETLPFDRGALRQGPVKAMAYSLSFAGELKRRKFDLVVDLQGLLRTGLMSAATRSPVRVGFENAREGSRRFYTHRVAVPDADRIHAVERYWRVAEFLGAGDSPRRFVVPLRPDAVATAASLLEAYPRPWLGLAVGARWLTKRWPPSHFAELANRAHARLGGTAVFVGTGEDTPLAVESARQLIGPYVDLTGRTSLPLLAAVLAKCDVMVSNDTGPLHLAAALGRPCVAPYTCTRAALHGPYGEGHHGVETTVACRGSYLRQCPHGLICMTDLTPEHLWRPLSAVLDRWAESSRGD